MSDFSEKAKKALRQPVLEPAKKVRLLSVDVGLKTAFACFDNRGKVIWLQSRHFNSPAVLRKGINSILQEMPEFEGVVLEGSGQLAKIWQKEMNQKKIPLAVIQAEEWRRDLLYPRERRTGHIAKAAANKLCEDILSWSRWQGIASKSHDAAEAILAGVWYLNQIGQIQQLPEELQIRYNINNATKINRN